MILTSRQVSEKTLTYRRSTTTFVSNYTWFSLKYINRNIPMTKGRETDRKRDSQSDTDRPSVLWVLQRTVWSLSVQGFLEVHDHPENQTQLIMMMMIMIMTIMFNRLEMYEFITWLKSGPVSLPSVLEDLGSLDWDPPDPETKTHHQDQMMPKSEHWSTVDRVDYRASKARPCANKTATFQSRH